MSEAIKLVVKEPPASIRLVTNNIIVREVAAEAGTLFILVDGSLGEDTALIPADSLVTKFLILAPNGTIISVTDIFENVVTGSAGWATYNEDLYYEDETLIEFTGVTTQTVIKVYYQ